MTDQNRIDRYLFDEMNEQERAELEDGFVGDEALFYDMLERENELVDRYNAGSLSGDERTRFERTLETNPARREKVANASLLREFISDERPKEKTITIAERTSWLDLFRIRGLQFASAGLVVLFALWSTYLLVENRRLRSLDQELADARGREANLESQIDSSEESVGALTADLNSERERIKQLEEEISKIKKTGPPISNTAPPPPTIATLILGVGVRGGPPLTPQLELAPGVKRVSVSIELDANAGDRVSAKVNGDNFGTNIKVQKGGVVLIAVPVTRLKDGRNTIEILDASGAKLSEYPFLVSRK